MSFDLGGINYEVIRVYRMLDPKPKELLTQSRRFVREGSILQWNAKERKHKPKYFFLFNDCMLITKKEAQKRYWLKVYISLNPGIKIADVTSSSYHIPNVEFRLFAPKRSFIFFASSSQVKRQWIDDIQASIDRGKRKGRVTDDGPGVIQGGGVVAPVTSVLASAASSSRSTPAPTAAPVTYVRFEFK
jgi:SOS1/NGEF-like PH domain